MGAAKEKQALVAATVFLALAAVCGRSFQNGISESQSWTGLALYGIPTFVFLTLGIASLDIWTLQPANSHTLKGLVTYYLFYRLLHFYLPIARWKIRKLTADPRKTNEKSLMHILHRSRNSEYGLKYKFSEIKSQEDFVQKHPITTQEDYREYMERMAAGEENLVFTGKLKALISTSGTTGKPKIYAWSEDHLNSFKSVGVFGMVGTLRYMNLQRYLPFHIHSPIKKTDAGVPIGAGSQVVQQDTPFSLIPNAYRKLQAEDASFYAQALFSLAERELRFIQGFSADLMYSFWKFIGEKWNDICQDIENGYIGEHIDMPEDIRQELSQCLTADSARAADLRKAMQNGCIVGLAKRIWPDIAFISIGKSAAFRMCAELLMDNQFKGINIFGGFHGATESFTGLNMEEQTPEEGEILTLLTTPSFVEFIPIEDVEKENPETVFPENVKVGELYEVVHTSLNGIYRCRYGDIIKIVGYKNKTPKYEFAYKLGQRLNIAYERTPDSFLFDTIKECEQFLPPGVKIVNYTTTESIAIEKFAGQQGKGHYVYFMEFETDEPLRLDTMAKEMDQALYNMYQPYKRFKDIDSIGQLRIVQVKCGTFENLKAYIWSNPHSQFKMPRVQRREPALKFLLEQAV